MAAHRSRLCVIIGLLFMVAGIANLMSLEHPLWFACVDVPIYMALALLAGRLLVREPAE